MGQTFVYNEGSPKVLESELRLEFGIFFDGTLNNKRNTELREKYRDKENHIEDTDDKETVLKKEAAIKATREKQEKEFDALKDDKIGPNDSEYERYLKSSHRGSIDKLGLDNSFSNDFTNVARMWKCCKEEYAIYVEGIGTLDDNRDVDDGFQYGSGFTGIRGKVRKGCELLAEKIFNAKKNIDKTKKLSQITIDVSGFSRGAAAARNFVYEINGNKRPQDIAIQPKRIKDGINVEKISPNYGNDFQTDRYTQKYKTIYIDKDKVEIDPQYLDNGKMPKFGYLGYYLLSKGVLSKTKDLDDLSITIRFIGVYDTVSSYEEFGDMGTPERVGLRGGIHSIRGPKHYFGNDLEQLQLNNLGGYSKAVHFTAMDEHRENFDLTRFPGSTEKNLPGVHCDIGGAYETGTETVDEIETSNHKPLWSLNQLRQKLIDEYWYKDDQIDIKNGFWNVITAGTVYRKLRGTRFLKKEYSYIPLHFMGQFCEPYINENIIRDVVNEYPVENDNILKQAKTHLEKYVFGSDPEWRFVDDEELKRIKQRKAEKEKFDKEMDIMNGKMKNPEPVYDNLDPNKYLPKTIPILRDTVPPISEILIDGKKEKVTILDEVTVIGYTNQGLLRKLRNEYFHWSANRDWLGMDPTDDYKRVEH